MRVRITASILCVLAAGASGVFGQTVTRGPYLQLGTPTSIVVRWRTDLPTDSQVSYGTTILLGTFVTDSAPVTEHVVTITGLNPATRYWYSAGTSAQVLAAGSAYFFVTAPVPGTRQPTRIWVLGDSGRVLPEAYSVRDAYYAFTGSRHTDLWMMLGDNAYEYGTDAEYQLNLFHNKYEAMLQKSVLWPTLGNHDGQSANSTTQTGPYYDNFTLPAGGEAGGVASGTEAYYSFDYANIHFVCLDSYDLPSGSGSPMATWLAADLSANAREWTVAFWHHPPYSKGSHDSDTEGELIAMRQNICPILEAHGVDLVLCGHSHDYERSMMIDGHYGLSSTFGPQYVVNGGNGQIGGGGAYRKASLTPAPHTGTVYVVSGTGSLAYTAAPLDHPIMVHSEATCGSLVLEVDGDQLDCRFIDLTGVTRDSFTMIKGPSTGIVRPHTLVPPFSTWKYHDLGVDLGAAWRASQYNDASWASGPGVLGFGETYIATTVSYGPDPNAKYPTTYFRKSFTLPSDPALVDSLRLYANYDDGFVAWLNGQYAASSPSLPTATPTYSQLAASHEGGAYEVFGLPAALLVPGTNVLAIEVHQTSATSSDLVWDGAIDCDAFVPLLGAPGAGNAGADALLLNGSAGGAARGIDLGQAASVTIAVNPPPPASTAPFALFAKIGTPTSADAYVLPYGIGTMSFPPSLLAPAPNLVFLASSFVLDPSLVFVTSPAPWSLTLTPGLPPGFTAALQGVVVDTSFAYRVTNGVLLTVVP